LGGFDPTERRRLGRSRLTLSRLGFGSAPLGGLFEAVGEAEAAGALAAAWAVGLRHFDTAPQYGFGLAEHRVGAALRERPREAFVLSSKVGKLLRRQAPGAAPGPGMWVGALPFDVVFDYGYDATMRSVEDSLQRLGIDRIDLLFIHDVNRKYHGADVEERFREAVAGACRAVERLRGDGTIAAYGIGQNDWDISMRFAEAADPGCFMLAGRYTLIETSALASFLPMCGARGIGVLLAGPFNSGLLAGGTTYDYGPADPAVVARALSLQAVCARHGVPLAAAALQFPLHHPAVTSVVAGMRRAAEVEANAALMRVAIPADLWAELKRERLIPEEAPTA
jgi:D-threo-aldose 1-dehydrogenase